MVAKLYSMSFYGLNTIPVEIEVDIRTKVPSFEIVGMPDAAVRESVKRIETAIQNSMCHFPGKRIIVNLAPAGIKKVGTLFDLPIALGILDDAYSFENLHEFIIIGELSLDGSVRPMSGALPIAIKAKELGYIKLLCPAENASEMAIVEGLEIIPISTLRDAIDFLSRNKDIKPQPAAHQAVVDSPLSCIDMSDIKGQESAKRAIEVSAAGGHNSLLIGPPGTGKTMLAKRIPTILPDMTMPEALETTMIYSIAGMVDRKHPLLWKRPFRTPHHTASDISIIGGGKFPRPGEISLAHNGVLFMDELQQFKSNVLQTLRQPLEDYCITISRAEGTAEFPANFMMVAALNPSKRNNDIDKWDAEEMRKLLSKISGPFLDRIDIQIQVPRVQYDDLRNSRPIESSADIRARVLKARQIQLARLGNEGIYTNSQMNHRQIEKYCPLSSGGESLLKLAMERFMLSIRAYDKIRKIARTIADLESSEKIEDHQISEALQYRVLDRIVNLIS